MTCAWSQSMNTQEVIGVQPLPCHNESRYLFHSRDHPGQQSPYFCFLAHMSHVAGVFLQEATSCAPYHVFFFGDPSSVLFFKMCPILSLILLRGSLGGCYFLPPSHLTVTVGRSLQFIEGPTQRHKQPEIRGFGVLGVICSCSSRVLDEN